MQRLFEIPECFLRVWVFFFKDEDQKSLNLSHIESVSWHLSSLWYTMVHSLGCEKDNCFCLAIWDCKEFLQIFILNTNESTEDNPERFGLRAQCN